MIFVFFTTTGLPVKNIQNLGSKTDTWYKGRVLVGDEWKWGLWNAQGKAQFDYTGDLK